MKVRILLVVSLVSVIVTAQDTNYTQPSENKPTSELQKLAVSLTKTDRTESAKVYSIFKWIADNIDYRVKHSPARVREKVLHADDTGALKSLDERVAEGVYRNRLAVCDGYARLFKTLCDYAGIQSAVVTGYGRVEYGRVGSKFRSNHTWNAVMIDSVWHLLDVTWATGHLTWNGGEFVRRYDSRYFLTDPRTFIYDHYPDDLRWTLLDAPPLMMEYKNSPYKQRAFIKYSIRSFFPAKGILEANVDDTLNFSITAADIEKDKLVSSDPFLDTADIVSKHAVILTSYAADKKIFYYQHVLSSADTKWIYLMYNGDIVLRYRVHIKERLAVK